MVRILDVAPLRSFVAVADCGGFQRAANSLHLSQGAEHAAAQLLPGLASSLADALPDCRLRFRVDRGAQLRKALADGRIDVAMLLGPSDDLHARTVGRLELTWYSVPDWTLPGTDEPIPLVAFDDPCAPRSRALETLSAHGIQVEVNCEAAHRNLMTAQEA